MDIVKCFGFSESLLIDFPRRMMLLLSVALLLSSSAWAPISWGASAAGGGGGPGCPSGCLCDDDTFVVSCERGRLDVVPIALNPAIQRLVLRANRIKTVDAAFQFYRDLQFVDLSSNHLVAVPAGSFAHQQKLQELHLARNKLSALGNRTFEGLRSLVVLNLRENFLEELPARVFAAAARLEELNLGQNRISRVDPLAFDGLKSLRVLYLDDNQLKSVPTAAFAISPSLAELHVGLNGFSELPDDAFKGLDKLTVLDLSSGGISNISENAFRGLTGLRTLNLADNRLERVPTLQLTHLVRLEELAIGQNEFQVLEASCFEGLTNLRRLDITSATKLERVARGAFAPNLNLETVVLASNFRLVTLEAGALMPLPNLRHLVLRGNALSSPPEAAAPWASLRSLDLRDNPLHCDCALQWLAVIAGNADSSSSTRSNATSVAGGATCSTPAPLKERPLRSLSPADLGCAAPGDPRRRAILVTFCAGAGVLLAALGLLLFRYRQRVREALKDYRWNKRTAAALSRKEHEYHKTFSDDCVSDGYIIRPPLPPPSHLKPIPVTEL